MRKLKQAVLIGLAAGAAFFVGYLLDYVFFFWGEALFPFAIALLLGWAWKLDAGEDVVLALVAGVFGGLLEWIWQVATNLRIPLINSSSGPSIISIGGDAFFAFAMTAAGALIALMLTMKRRG